MPQVWSPVWQRLGNIVHVFSLNTQEVATEESEVQGHLWLLREFKANLRYSRSWRSSQGSRLSLTHLSEQAISDSTALAHGTLTQKFSFLRIIGVLDIFPGYTDRERKSSHLLFIPSREWKGASTCFLSGFCAPDEIRPDASSEVSEGRVSSAHVCSTIHELCPCWLGFNPGYRPTPDQRLFAFHFKCCPGTLRNSKRLRSFLSEAATQPAFPLSFWFSSLLGERFVVICSQCQLWHHDKKFGFILLVQSSEHRHHLYLNSFSSQILFYF